MTGLTFYTNPMSRGQIVRWMLEEVGAPYEQVLLDYDTTMKADDYLAINPMGKVPAIRHDGHVVTECAAICAYLADAFPEAGLAPQNDAERADYYRWMFFAAGPTEQAIIDHTVLNADPNEEQQRMAGYGSYDLVVDTLEKAVTGRDHICGDRFTAADVYVGSQIGWGVQFGTLPKRDAFEAYAGRLAERDAYKRAKEIDQKLMPEQPAAS
ncbi:MAG: glutathione S-transferase family protein [Parasphingopyxis sp.]|uniref:glutathione S-transferase family protein n=1 Tax=Parasphingopyxis sp. TaxID=1920299 RepID=UPI003FA00182